MPFIQENNYSYNLNCVSNTLFALNSQPGIFEPTRPNKLSTFESIGHNYFKVMSCQNRANCV